MEGVYDPIVPPQKKNKMEGVYEPIVPPQKMGASPGKNLGTSPDSSIRSVLSFNSDNYTSTNAQFDDEAVAAAPEDPLQMLVQNRLSKLAEEHRKNQSVTIYRVPASFRKKRKVLYEPRMVSIGPYYYGREELRAIEEHKWWYLRDFMSRKPQISLNIYICEIRRLEPQARQCYSESFQLTTDEFVLMLLLDGCFILEYFNKYEHKEIDVLCDVGWGGPTIISDLLLLENQIPFFIIHKLASISSDLKNCQSCKDRCDLVQKLYALLPYQEMLSSGKVSCKTIHHLLHLYYICLVPESYSEHLLQHPNKRSLSWHWMRDPQQVSEGKESHHHRSSVIIPCAAELHDSGVKFRRNTSHRLFEITFEKGVIEMPLLVVDNSIRTIFTNLVAFEQSQISRSGIFTSYVVLWNMLIDTARDVSILEHCGIMELVQHNEEQAADFFNELADCWSMDYDDHYYQQLFLNLQRYCSSTWYRSRAKLMHDYFNNPWSSISVVAGVILLILTVVQTYYTVYPDGGPK